MATMAELMEMNAPRFKQPGQDAIYNAFDAFLKVAFIEGKLPDFSKDLVVAEDGSVSFVAREEDFEPLMEKYVRTMVAIDKKKASKDQDNGESAGDKDLLLVECVLNWIWTLGTCNANTSCGAAGKALDLDEKGTAFATKKTGLWATGMSAAFKKNDMALLAWILRNNCQLCHGVTDLQVVKEKLERSALKAAVDKKCASASIRNAMLHFANPDLYMHFYTAGDKVAFVSERSSDYQARAQKFEKFSGEPAFYKTKEYLARYTDMVLCEIFDGIRNREDHKNIEYHEFMTKFVYVKREAKPSKKAKAD